MEDIPTITTSSDHGTTNDWSIKKAIKALAKSSLVESRFGELLSEILAILQDWSDMWVGVPKWAHFADFKGFLHEVEEALLPLSIVIDCCVQRSARISADHSSIVVIDLCCGKGMFGILLSALATKRPVIAQHVGGIVMAEKQTNIRWEHIEYANAAAQDPTNTEFKVPITVWKGINIFSDDLSYAIRSKIRQLDSPSVCGSAVLVGIHLCRRLSSRFIELANSLEARRVCAAVLAPCCLPCFGGPDSRRPISIPSCPTPDSAFKSPEQLAQKKTSRLDIIFKTCWKCGVFGHRREECVADTLDRKLNINKLWKEMESESIASLCSTAQTVLNLADLSGMLNPFAGWCDFLFSALNDRGGSKEMTGIVLDVVTGHCCDINCSNVHGTDMDSGIDNANIVGSCKPISYDDSILINVSQRQPLKKQKRDKDWNSNRKMTWIVGIFDGCDATRTVTTTT